TSLGGRFDRRRARIRRQRQVDERVSSGTLLAKATNTDLTSGSRSGKKHALTCPAAPTARQYALDSYRNARVQFAPGRRWLSAHSHKSGSATSRFRSAA